jgi:hypothetical protein
MLQDAMVQAVLCCLLFRCCLLLMLLGRADAGGLPSKRWLQLMSTESGLDC